MGMRAAHNLTSQDRLESVSNTMVTSFFTSESDPSPAVEIDLLTADVLSITETGQTLTIQLQVTGYSYGIIPLRILPLTYDQFEEMREIFGVNSTFRDIASSERIPGESAQPCE